MIIIGNILLFKFIKNFVIFKKKKRKKKNKIKRKLINFMILE